ncbi:hypothetical protein Kpho02_60110 [Kitasatospora phosalacinea]|uniref:Uncharacterized protein n=1 Tax=Kitasatospora phosalacinea TaxID=2065 RepID=A0A9W6V4X4_9ACTN|nr:hypothetical protein [Kitasatospora phosalacinea]GLW73713.1 hypothetical protein Kpho02_60110 [Kitasatospora phosalacinea]
MIPHYPEPATTPASLTAAHGPGLARLLGAQAADVTPALFGAYVFEAIEALHRADRHGEAEALEDVLALLTDAALDPGTARARVFLEAADHALHRDLPAILTTTDRAAKEPATVFETTDESAAADYPTPDQAKSDLHVHVQRLAEIEAGGCLSDGPMARFGYLSVRRAVLDDLSDAAHALVHAHDEHGDPAAATAAEELAEHYRALYDQADRALEAARAQFTAARTDG